MTGRPVKSRSFDGFQFQYRHPAGRCQNAAADFPVDVQRRAAEILVRTQRGIDVGDPIERVEAGRRVAEVRRNLRVLAIGRPQRGRDAGDHLGVTLRTLAAIVGGPQDCEPVGWRDQQLTANARVVQVVHDSCVFVL